MKERALRRTAGLSVHTAMVYDDTLAKSVSAEHYTDFIVPAERLL